MPDLSGRVAMRAATATIAERVTTLEQRVNNIRKDLDAVTALSDLHYKTIKANFAGIGKGL